MKKICIRLLDSMIDVMTVTALMFLIALNPMLHRLTAMLPDETLRAETKLFSMLNRWLLYGIVGVLAIYFIAVRFNPLFLEQVLESALHALSLPQSGGTLLLLLDRAGLWIVLILVLLPVAMTMALIWKIKEVILASVFGPEH